MLDACSDWAHLVEYKVEYCVGMEGVTCMIWVLVTVLQGTSISLFPVFTFSLFVLALSFGETEKIRAEY